MSPVGFAFTENLLFSKGVNEVKMAQQELVLVGALLDVSITPWFYVALFAATVFIKSNAFVNGYGEPCEIIYLDINNIWQVLDPLISRQNALHTLSILKHSGEGQNTRYG